MDIRVDPRPPEKGDDYGEPCTVGTNHFLLEFHGKGIYLSYQRIGVVEYFRQTYNLKIKYPLLPCAVVEIEKKNHFIPLEFCKIVEQRFNTQLTEDQTLELENITCKGPMKREGVLQPKGTEGGTPEIETCGSCLRNVEQKVVASVDWPDCTSYITSIESYKDGIEIITNLSKLVHCEHI
ncbi:hypothetical protein RJ640_029518 [Escallonia rubra]|uniref:PAZ domain-containing protein n=1 Tax=Escallonia rubra TaxID=112253 RepID=A0AA88S1I9_9ASTE|nr:hypothetical protein RJ640_029518 [Escallonia rubra]